MPRESFVASSSIWSPSRSPNLELDPSSALSLAPPSQLSPMLAYSTPDRTESPPDGHLTKTCTVSARQIKVAQRCLIDKSRQVHIAHVIQSAIDSGALTKSIWEKDPAVATASAPNSDPGNVVYDEDITDAQRTVYPPHETRQIGFDIAAGSIVCHPSETGMDVTEAVTHGEVAFDGEMFAMERLAFE